MKLRELPYSVIVVDYMHWPKYGDWRFDPRYWPDPRTMLREVRAGGVETVVSVWPTVEPTSTNFAPLAAEGLLVGTETGGCDAGRQSGAGVTEYDALNPAARQYHWAQLRQHYYDLGVRGFWLDADEGGGSVGEDIPWPRVDETYSSGSAVQVRRAACLVGPPPRRPPAPAYLICTRHAHPGAAQPGPQARRGHSTAWRAMDSSPPTCTRGAHAWHTCDRTMCWNERGA